MPNILLNMPQAGNNAMFDKRQNGISRGQSVALSLHPEPDTDGIRRVIPLSLWKTEMGRQLRALGFCPDGVNNVVSGTTAQEMRFKTKFAEQKTFFAEYNAQPLEGVKLVPFAMIPWELWHGEHGSFLMRTCGVYPVEAWNTLMLPEDGEGAQHLDLVAHPRRYPKEYTAGCGDIMSEIRDEFAASCRRIGRKALPGDPSSITHHEQAVARARNTVVQAASGLAAMLLGEKVIMQHQSLFGHLY